MATEGDKSSLPDDNDQLKKLILEMQEKQAEMEERLNYQDTVIDALQDEVTFLKGLKYARTSEKWTAEDKKQMNLFNEIEQIEAEEQPKEPEN